MCPKCGGPVHRSRTRGLTEKLVKVLTANRTYRCFDCEWRGWLEATDISQLREAKRRRLVRTIISILVTILVTALIAVYLVRNTHAGVVPGWGDSLQHDGSFEQARSKAGRAERLRRLTFSLDSRGGVLQQWVSRKVSSRQDAPAQLIGQSLRRLV